MAAMREADLPGLAGRGFPGLAGALLYGTDEESIAGMSRAVQRAWTGGEVSVIEAASLRGQQGALRDLLGSRSLFGGRGLVAVLGAEDQHGALLIPMLGAEHANAFLIVAGSLRKNSALRAAAEGSRACAVLAVHAEDEAAQLIRIRRNASALGLSLEPGAAERLLELCGANRGLIAAELEKLSLLQLKGGEVTRQAVEESCGEQGESGFNAVFEELLEGNVAGLDKALARTFGTADFSALLPLLQGHLARLAAIRAAVDEGLGWEAAFQKARPPVYFGQQAQVKRQLSGLTLEGLLRLQAQVQEIVFQSRSVSPLGDLVTARGLLAQGLRLSGLKEAAIR